MMPICVASNEPSFFDLFYLLSIFSGQLTVLFHVSLCSYRVRFHYGHPDVFDRLFHLTRGGVSKASKIINLSEDIFAGMIINFIVLSLL